MLVQLLHLRESGSAGEMSIGADRLSAQRAAAGASTHPIFEASPTYGPAENEAGIEGIAGAGSVYSHNI